MGHLNIPDFDPEAGERLLLPNLYTVEVVDAQIMQTKRGFDQLLLHERVVEGPPQADGSDPVGREISDFILLDPAAATKDKGVELIRRRVEEAFAAFSVPVSGGDFDEHDFVGKTAIAKVKPGEDADGFPRDTVVRYKKLG